MIRCFLYKHQHCNDGTDVGIFKTLMPILEEHPRYSLYLTSHSLGEGDHHPLCGLVHEEL